MFRNLSKCENSISLHENNIDLYENNNDLFEDNVDLYENNIDFERRRKQSPGVILYKSFSEKFYKACRKISFIESFFA